MRMIATVKVGNSGAESEYGFDAIVGEAEVDSTMFAVSVTVTYKIILKNYIRFCLF